MEEKHYSSPPNSSLLPNGSYLGMNGSAGSDRSRVTTTPNYVVSTLPRRSHHASTSPCDVSTGMMTSRNAHDVKSYSLPRNLYRKKEQLFLSKDHSLMTPPRDSSGKMAEDVDTSQLSQTKSSEILERTNMSSGYLNPLTISEYKTHAEQSVSPSLPSHFHGNTSFHSRLVEFYSEQGGEACSERLRAYVEGYIRELLAQVSHTDPRFVGKLKNCCVLGPTHLKEENRFEYLLELSDNSLSLEEIHVEPSESGQQWASGMVCYGITFKREIAHKWKCSTCRESPSCGKCRTLSPSTLQRDLAKALETTLLKHSKVQTLISLENSTLSIIFKLLRKTAQELFFTHKPGDSHETEDNIFLRVDITIGVPIATNVQRSYHGIQNLRPGVEISGSGGVRRFHMIPSGDVWIASFAEAETTKIRKLVESGTGRKTCYLALKHLCEQTLSCRRVPCDSRLWRVPFLRECHQFPLDDSWDFWQLSERTRNMLGGQLSGTPPANNSSYDEASRPQGPHSNHGNCQSSLHHSVVSGHLETLARAYTVCGGIHSVLFGCMLLCHLLILAFTGEFLRSCSKSGCPSDALVSMVFTNLPITSANLAIVSVGLSLTVIGRFYSHYVHYRMYKMVLHVYIVLVIEGLLLFVSGVVLRDHVTRGYSRSETVAAVTALSSAVVLLLAGVHVVLYMVNIRAQARKHSWEIIFCDYIYRDICCAAVRNRHKLPRVSVSLNKDMDLNSDSDDICETDRRVGQQAKPPSPHNGGMELFRHKPTLTPMPPLQEGVRVPRPMSAEPYLWYMTDICKLHTEVFQPATSTPRSPRNLDGTPRNLDGTPRNLDRTPRNLDGTPRYLDGTPRNLDRTPRNLDGTPRNLDRSKSFSDGPQPRARENGRRPVTYNPEYRGREWMSHSYQTLPTGGRGYPGTPYRVSQEQPSEAIV